MKDYRRFYIGGQWVEPVSEETLAVIDPSREEPFATIALANDRDVDRAVEAAHRAFEGYSSSRVSDRLELLKNFEREYKLRSSDIAAAITQEMGAPVALAMSLQVASGLSHIQAAISVLGSFEFSHRIESDIVVKEPIGVCALITPWNWPMNQAVLKIAYALAAGCTIVFKPSEETPVSAALMTEALAASGVPAGVFNLINGSGPGAGSALAAHKHVDMVSFTGSTVAGVSVARAGAETVKRVSLELGGKSPNIILEDADFEDAVVKGAKAVFRNSGQTCLAPTRMLVPAKRMAEAARYARLAADNTVVGDPLNPGTKVGPLVNARQFDRVQQLIKRGIDEGATLVAGGLGKPEGLDIGYFVKPTVFSDVENSMTIAQEEIFGPVLSIIPYETENDAVRIANDTPYGLAGYVWSKNAESAYRVAKQIRAGIVVINGAFPNNLAPFGGMKQSGNGREQGVMGIEEYLETKVIAGCEDLANRGKTRSVRSRVGRKVSCQVAAQKHAAHDCRV
ncbi:aldehyde dehydrogenase family protein [Ensifer sp. ENS07]|uniref:aldehyde dehydrogenase family protein n=1 Tax=Ensifer sp. ENS07 TaxID=2769274 RepID=UPI0017805288|nr:aldehyde dehydrogenase family protein [Ensifer sp. ENS07]MBD9641784.1 aldehyde dehydrogenase family protein [Ensifer sp. ENS07]